MNNITELIKTRRSVRIYDGKELDESTKEQILSFINGVQNPFNIPVEFKFLDAKEYGLTCPVVTGTNLYVGGKIECVPNASVAFGYSFEMFVLYAQSLGLGTVWLGGTMNRSAFERAMELTENQMMPCASPIGFAAKKMSMRESLMRKAVRANDRLPFDELFFDGSFDVPLREYEAGKFDQALKMVRLAPSAVNKQPWRVVVADDTAHFYLKRSKGFSHEGTLDMQMIDMGIALCHFALTAKQNDLNIEFKQDDPKLTQNTEFEYIASYKLCPSLNA